MAIVYSYGVFAMNEVLHKFDPDRDYFSLAASNYVVASAIVREIT